VKISSIQILRAIAALLVVFSHFLFAVEYAGIKLKIHDIGHISSIGIAGVSMFFAISGFIITHIGYSSFGKPNAAIPFIINRALRIYPIYWILTIIATIIWISGFGFRSVSVSPEYLLKSFFCFPMTSHPIIDQGWSLPYELYFYILFSLGIAFSKTARTFIIAISIWFSACIIASMLSHANGMFAYFGSIHLASFVFGTLAAIAYRSYLIPKNLLSAVSLTFIGAVSIVYVYGLAPESIFSIPLLAESPLYCLLLGALMYPNPNGLVATTLTRIGDASYSLYLTHGFLSMALPKILSRFHVGNKGGYLVLASGVVAAVIFGQIFWYFIERPIQTFVSQWLKTKSSK